MQEAPFVFVDIETNGQTGERGRIIEVAAIKVLGGTIIGEYQSLVQPGSSLPHWITTLTGITTHDLQDAPHFEEIASPLYEFMEGCIFTAHNVLFDYSFLRRQFKESGYSFTPKLFCTVKMSRAIFPEHKGHSLEKIIQRHELQTANRHRAYDDALAAYEYTKLAIQIKGVDAFKANLLLQTKTKSLPPNVDEQIILDLPNGPGIYIFEDDAGMALYVGKSVNIRNRVRSHFTNATTIAKEMKMSLQSHNVRYVQTETEVEALLLESAKVKELQPVYNRRLRRKKTQHIIVRHFDQEGYEWFSIESQDMSQYANLKDVYGVFTSKNQAKTTLDEISRTYQLCPKLLGLEKTTGFCFRYQLGQCRGACGGLESAMSYNERVEYALERTKIASWPFAGKIAVAISSHRSLIIDQWVSQSIYESNDDSYQEVAEGFDIDTYKILRSYIKSYPDRIRPLDR